MGFPAGIQLATVAFGIPLTVTGKDVVTTVTVKPTARVIWAATGQPLPEFADSFTAEAGQLGSFQVPFIDQAGFIDSTGAAVTDFAYQVTAEWRYGNERPITWSKNLKPLLGQSGPIDLDLVPDGPVSIPVTAPTAAVLGFGGRTGFVTLQESDLPSRLSEVELSATTATQVASEVSTPGKAAKAALDAFYVPKSLRGVGPTTFPPRPIVTPITTFQIGHGWSSAASAGGTAFAADTTDYLLGSQSLAGSTNGTGGNLEIISPTMTALNLTGKGLAFQLKVDNPDRLNYATIYWGDGNYTNFRTQPSAEFQGTGASSRLLPNDWTWFYIPLTDFTTTTGTVNDANITNVKIRFADMNTGPITVRIQQVGTYTPKTTYPNGVLSVTCDDSLLSQYTYLPQIMNRYGAGATMLLIADQMAGSPNYVGTSQCFSTDQAHILEDKHGYEMGGHAYTAANHNAGLATLNATQLTDELGSLKAWLRTEGFAASDYFAWPVGSNDVPSTKIARKFFSWARHTGGYYAPAQYPSQPMRHQAVTVTSDTPLATFQGYIDYAKAHKRHLTLMVHQIVVSGASGATNVNRLDLTNILDYANAQGMPIRTIGQVMRGE